MSEIFKDDPFEKIIDIDSQRRRISAAIKKQALESPKGSDVETKSGVTNGFRELLEQGDVGGLSGADFYNDETWFDTPPPEK